VTFARQSVHMARDNDSASSCGAVTRGGLRRGARYGYPRKELIHRLRKRWCELCEHDTTVTVHQVAALKHLGRPGPGQPAWAALMARMRRKTLIVCAPCHEYIHANPVTHAA
jgi:AI2M/AI1M-like HNH endonuclease